MPTPLYLVDAFASRPFTGNPAGVCPLEGPADPQWMQNVATEMNQAETAFCWPVDGGYSLQWFTPVAEVDLCGHATLATAHVLWSSGRLGAEQEAVFETRSGTLTCKRTGDLIEMDFPSEAPEPCDCPESLAEALEAHILWMGKNRMDFLALLPSEEEVRALEPDMELLRKLQTRAVIVTAKSDMTGVDFVSRLFAPGLGIPEDPVTGSAHCALGPFWAERLGKTELSAYQASKRGGYVGVAVKGSRVLLRGQAVTVLSGSLED